MPLKNLKTLIRMAPSFKNENGEDESLLLYLAANCEIMFKENKSMFLDYMRVFIEESHLATKKDTSLGECLFLTPPSMVTGIFLDLLVEYGVDIDHVQKGCRMKWTKLMRDSYNGNLGGVMMLTDKGAKIDLKCHDGKTCFHLAAMGKHHVVMEWLENKGANFKTTDNDGNNVAHLLAKQPNFNKKDHQFLKRHPELINAKNAGQKTCLDIIKEKGVMNRWERASCKLKTGIVNEK